MPRDLKAELKYISENPSITKLMELTEEAIERAIAAEYKTACHVSCNDGLRAQLTSLDEENARLTAQVAGLREALEKLARLGNEPHYGNSTGNEIAKQALTSPDPGEKIMRVVEAAKKAIKYGPEFRNKDRGALERALAALEEGEQ